MTVEEVYTAYVFAEDLMSYIARRFELPAAELLSATHIHHIVPRVFTPEIGQAVASLSEKLQSRNIELFKRFLETNRGSPITVAKHFVDLVEMVADAMFQEHGGDVFFIAACTFVAKLFVTGCECGFNLFSFAVSLLADELNSKLSWGLRVDFQNFHDMAVRFNRRLITDTAL